MSSNDAMIARQLFAKGVNSVLPHVRLKQMLQFDGKNIIKVQGVDQEFVVPNEGCHVVGFGKAVIGMAAELQRILKPENIQKMILSVPHGISDQLRSSGQHIQLPVPQPGLTLNEGAKGNIPDDIALKSSKMILKSITDLKASDLVIVLISGGGSALLPAPKPPLCLNDKAKLTAELSKAGASIQELNSVRIQLSELKGGKLARKAQPAQVLGFILSDIIGDPLELISSGPTIIPKEIANISVLDILKKYNIAAEVCIQKAFKTNTNVDLNVSKFSENVVNVLIGSNKIALEACRENAIDENFETYVLSHELDGEAKLVGGCYGTLAFLASHDKATCNLDEIKTMLENLKVKDESVKTSIMNCIENDKPLCLISGGETTVKVNGNGKGGRNQEMVLAAMIKYQELVSKHENLSRKAEFNFLSAGTDGIDGPTDAAGALAYHEMISEYQKQGLDPYEYLNNNDSYSFFKNLGNGKDLIITGHTGTNVMDLQILLIQPFS